MGKNKVKLPKCPHHRHHEDPSTTPPFSIPPHKTEDERMHLRKHPPNPNSNKPAFFEREKKQTLASLPNKIHPRRIYSSLSVSSFLSHSTHFDSSATLQSRVSEILVLSDWRGRFARACKFCWLSSQGLKFH